MVIRNDAYQNYEGEEDFYYDDDENYDSSSYDNLLDFIIDNLQKYGCHYSIDEIKEFLTDFGDLTLAEWSRDLMDSNISEFTCNYINELMNQKYGTPTNLTPPINSLKMKTLTSLHENEKTMV
jgi:hypothetical protein